MIKSYVDVTTVTGEGYFNYMPKVVYVYSVDGVDYEGNKLFFLEDGRGSSWSYKKVEKYINKQTEILTNYKKRLDKYLEEKKSKKKIKKLLDEKKKLEDKIQD